MDAVSGQPIFVMMLLAAALVVAHAAAADRANKKGRTPLFIACLNGDIEAVRLLLKKGAEVDRAEKDDATPLYIACAKGNVDAARLLLENGAEVDRAGGLFGQTPLHAACWQGHVELARLLLEKGAAVDRAQKQGATPLHVACLNGHVEAALLLLDKGADVNRANENGMTPLYLARRNNHVDVVGLLLKKGAGGARGSVEYLGLWREPKRARNAVKMEGEGENVRIPTRIAFGRFVDELVKNKVPGGTFGIAQWTEWRGGNKSKNQPPTQVTVWRVYWSTKPGDTSYQRHGFAGMSSPTPERIVPFADFEPIAETLGGKNQIALYRVMLPREGLDPDKWAGRPPLPAPADLYTGPRSDGLLMRAGPYKVQSCPGRVAVTEKYTSSSAAYAPHRTRRIKRVHWHHNLKGIMPTDRRLVERYPANDGHEPIFLSLAGGGGVGN